MKPLPLRHAVLEANTPLQYLEPVIDRIIHAGCRMQWLAVSINPLADARAPEPIKGSGAMTASNQRMKSTNS